MVWEYLVNWSTGDMIIIISAGLTIWWSDCLEMSENIWECLKGFSPYWLTDWWSENVWECLKKCSSYWLTDCWSENFWKKLLAVFFSFFSDIQIIRETGCQSVSYSQTVMTSSPHQSGTEQRTVRRSEGFWLQHTKSSVAAHTAARERQSAGNKTEQTQEEGDTPDWEQQRGSYPSWATSVGFGQGVGHLPVSITWVGPCQRRGDVDGSIEVMLDEEGQRWASWGWVRDRTWTGSDHNEEYWRWYSD